MTIKNKAKNQNSAETNQIADLRLMEKRVNKLTARLWAGLFILFIMLAAGTLLFANLYYERLALALTGNYTMTSGDLLTAGDWNTLSDDFVDKSGDTMSGDLTVNGNFNANNINANNINASENLAVNKNMSVGGNINVNGSLCLGSTCNSTWSWRAWTTVIRCGGGAPKCPTNWTSYTTYSAPAGLDNCGTFSYAVCYKDQ